MTLHPLSPVVLAITVISRQVRYPRSMDVIIGVPRISELLKITYRNLFLVHIFGLQTVWSFYRPHSYPDGNDSFWWISSLLKWEWSYLPWEAVVRINELMDVVTAHERVVVGVDVVTVVTVIVIIVITTWEDLGWRVGRFQLWVRSNEFKVKWPNTGGSWKSCSGS